jgi:serine/threonine-protein kinase PknK
VAVKVLDPHGLHRQDLRSRFEQECKTLGMLGDHPNVVRVFQAGIGKSGSPYIVMEYLPAGSFVDRLDAEGPLPWEEVCVIGVKLAGALQSAHEAGVLHLDIKPANVLVGPDGEPKLADFGIARLRAALGVTTTTQTLALTVGYAAPELFEEDTPTTASDIYGLGATLFTLLAGHSPFLRTHDEEPSLKAIIGRTLFSNQCLSWIGGSRRLCAPW